MLSIEKWNHTRSSHSQIRMYSEKRSWTKKNAVGLSPLLFICISCFSSYCCCCCYYLESISIFLLTECVCMCVPSSKFTQTKPHFPQNEKRKVQVLLARLKANESEIMMKCRAKTNKSWLALHKITFAFLTMHCLISPPCSWMGKKHRRVQFKKEICARQTIRILYRCSYVCIMHRHSQYNWDKITLKS